MYTQTPQCQRALKKNDFFNYIIIKRENRASSNHSHRPTLTIPRVTDAANRLPQEVRTKKKKKNRPKWKYR